MFPIVSLYTAVALVTASSRLFSSVMALLVPCNAALRCLHSVIENFQRAAMVVRIRCIGVAGFPFVIECFDGVFPVFGEPPA